MQVGEKIIEQLGGKEELKEKIGASLFSLKNMGVTFKFKGFIKADKVSITLNNLDLYDVIFYNENKIVEEFNNVFVEDLVRLFEEYTNLHLLAK